MLAGRCVVQYLGRILDCDVKAVLNIGRQWNGKSAVSAWVSRASRIVAGLVAPAAHAELVTDANLERRFPSGLLKLRVMKTADSRFRAI
jgi:hypothetical protein